MSNLQVIKRDGRVVDFDPSRVVRAIERCLAECTSSQAVDPALIADGIRLNLIQDRFEGVTTTASVEDIQNWIEQKLIADGAAEAAKRYILYRAEHERLREDRPIPADVRAAFDESDRYFPTPLQKFQFFDKYSRFNPTLGRRETWIETVDRTVDFLYELARPYADLGADTYSRIRTGILEMRVMPSMRLLAMAGPAARRNNVALFNCSFAGVDALETFSEALSISMAGCGFGFSVEEKYIGQLPMVKKQYGLPPTRLVIEDSSEGWADALLTGLRCWFEGHDLAFDFSLIRPAGTPLQIKGGRASGPEPLKTLLAFCRAKVLSCQGKRLRPIDAHDMICAIGQGVVSGGVRRTAMISLFDEDDQAMLHCKDGDFATQNNQRWNANNSIVTSMTDPILFAEQFLSMLKSGRGEPGLFNPEAALSLAPARRTLGQDFGTNPCLSGDTVMLTRNGLVAIETLAQAEDEIELMTPSGWSKGRAWKTGTKPVVTVKLSNGQAITVTRDHRLRVGDAWVEAGQTLGMTIQPFLSTAEWSSESSWSESDLERLGFIQGDGSFRHDCDALVINLGSDDDDVDRLFSEYPHHGDRVRYVSARDALTVQIERLGMSRACLPERRLPTDIWSLTPSQSCAFLRGLFSANGCVQDHYRRISLKGTCREMVAEVQVLLAALGMRTYITTNQPHDIQWKNGDYTSRVSYDLNVAADSIGLFRDKINFLQRYKRDILSQIKVASRPGRKILPTVVDISDAGIVDVYDFSVEDDSHSGWANGLQVHNCGEINLRNREFCNLTAGVVRVGDTVDDLIEKVSLAALIGTIQSLATYFPGLRPEWRANCEEERLLGVDMTGQQDNPGILTPNTLFALKNAAIHTNKIYADQLGINRSAAITCAKPSGNSSQLLDCSSGIHARWAPYYIRNVRVSAASPLAAVLKDAGFPLAPENGDDPTNPRTWVASFPIKAPEGAVTRNDRSAVEQCDWWLRNKLHYTEHNPSVTITYQPSEAIDLMAWVWGHRDKIGGMAFLPAFNAGYDQLPYIEIDRAEYERRVAELPEVEFAKVYRHELVDRSSASSTPACEGPICLIEA